MKNIWKEFMDKKPVRCIDCACCNVEEMKCYPNDEDCHKEYNLEVEDLVNPAICDFFIHNK